jgi:hypothetical protein
VFTVTRGDHFWFGSVFIYKNNQTEILCNTKNQIKTESKSVQTEQFRFDYFILKTETQPTDFGSVQFGLVILYFKKTILFFGGFFYFLMGLVSVCSVFFGSVFFSGSVWFFVSGL